jgi:hypothetical protein
MEPEPKNPSASGYQPRPAALPSAGRALSVLIAVSAVLWLWIMLPELWPVSTNSQLRPVVYSAWLLMPLVLLANYLVFRWATLPMWRGIRPGLLADARRGFVLLLGVLFHLLSPVWVFLLPAALALGV